MTSTARASYHDDTGNRRVAGKNGERGEVDQAQPQDAGRTIQGTSDISKGQRLEDAEARPGAADIQREDVQRKRNTARLQRNHLRLMRILRQPGTEGKSSDDEGQDGSVDDKEGLLSMIVAGAEQQPKGDRKAKFKSMKSRTKAKSQRQIRTSGAPALQNEEIRSQSLAEPAGPLRDRKKGRDHRKTSAGHHSKPDVKLSRPRRVPSRALDLESLSLRQEAINYQLSNTRRRHHQEEEVRHKIRPQEPASLTPESAMSRIVPEMSQETAKSKTPRPPFRIGSFWHKLRELSTPTPAEETPGAEVDQAKLDMDESELQQDIERAKSQAHGKVTPEHHWSAFNASRNRDVLIDSVIASAPSAFSPPEVYTTPEESASREDGKTADDPGNTTTKARSVHVQPSPSSQVEAVTKNARRVAARASGRRAIDLLSELFPEAIDPSSPSTSASKTSSSDPKAPRQVARLVFSPSIAALEEAVNTHEADISTAAANRAAAKEQLKAKERWRRLINESISVLVLRKASMHLAVSDFTSISPTFSSQHLNGWNNKNDILRVIRARDTETYEALPTYFLVFGSEEAAKAYRDHAFALHNLARTFSPVTGFGSPRLSLRGKIPDPSAASRYTLALPGHDLDLRLARQPLSNLMRKVLETEGYAGLQDRAQSEWEVLLTVDSTSWPTVRDLSAKDGRDVLLLRRALLNDSRDRGALWSLIDNAHHGVRELDLSDRKAGDETSDQAEQGQSSSLPQPPQHKKFVISFTSKSEAFRFVSIWHRRDIRSLLGSASDETDEVIVDAEIVW